MNSQAATKEQEEGREQKEVAVEGQWKERHAEEELKEEQRARHERVMGWVAEQATINKEEHEEGKKVKGQKGGKKPVGDAGKRAVAQKQGGDDHKDGGNGRKDQEDNKDGEDDWEVFKMDLC